MYISFIVFKKRRGGAFVQGPPKNPNLNRVKMRTSLIGLRIRKQDMYYKYGIAIYVIDQFLRFYIDQGSTKS